MRITLNYKRNTRFIGITSFFWITVECFPLANDTHFVLETKTFLNTFVTSSQTGIFPSTTNQFTGQIWMIFSLILFKLIHFLVEKCNCLFSPSKWLISFEETFLKWISSIFIFVLSFSVNKDDKWFKPNKYPYAIHQFQCIKFDTDTQFHCLAIRF